MPLCAGLLVALASASGYIYFLRDKVESATRKAAELEKQIVASEQQRKEHLAIALENYRNDVDGHKKQVEDVKLSHEQTREFLSFLVRAMDRLNPGWLQDRINGKPEYDLIITEPNKLTGAALVKAQMRPAPKPRSPVGDATAKVFPPRQPPMSGAPVNFDDDDPPKK